MAMIELEKPYEFYATPFNETSDLINKLIQSNNEQEERLRKLEDNKQTITVDPRVLQPMMIQGFCHCDKPMTGLGSRNCLRCGDVLVQQA